MKVVLVLGVLVVAVAATEVARTPKQFFMQQLKKKAKARVTGMNYRIDDIRERIHGIRDEFDEKIQEGRKAVELIHDVEDRVHRFTGDGCDDHHHQCEDHGRSCVHEVVVCDHTNDCPNGHDESDEVCVNHAVTGTVLEGDVDHSECMTDVHEDHIKISIVGETRYNEFPSVVEIKAHLYAHLTDGTTFEHDLEGQYYFSRKEFILYPAEDMEAKLDVICRFYGRENDRCHLRVVHEATQEACMETELHKH